MVCPSGGQQGKDPGRVLDEPTTDAIAIRGVSKTFGQGAEAFKALNDISIDIRQNEFFTLLGPSGCGKTTLLRLIAGFDFPSVARSCSTGQDIARLPPYKRPINTVFQNYALFPHMTVAQNIGFGLEMLGRPKADIEARVERDAGAGADGGAAQPRAPARSRAASSSGWRWPARWRRSPRCCCWTSRFRALDYKLRKEMQIELKRLQHETGITFIFVTHDQEEALTMSRPHRGHVEGQGAADRHRRMRSTTGRPNASSPNFIGETNFLAGRRHEHCRRRGAGAAARRGHGFGAGVPEGDGARGPGHRGGAAGACRDRPAQEAGATFTGTVSNIVYFGTDTHYHV